MDMNGMPGEAFPLAGRPVGFSLALAANESAMAGYAGLTETEREHLILRCKDARSKEEMQKIVDSLVPDGNVSALANEESMLYGPLENNGAF